MKTLASMLLIAYLSAAATASAEVLYEVHFTEEEMTLDGRADEQSWSLAPTLELTDRAYRSLKPISPASTRVRALWNERGLLVLYQCQDQNILATITKRDSSVYMDDDVELFLDPDMDRCIGACWSSSSESLTSASSLLCVLSVHHAHRK